MSGWQRLRRPASCLRNESVPNARDAATVSSSARAAAAHGTAPKNAKRWLGDGRNRGRGKGFSALSWRPGGFQDALAAADGCIRSSPNVPRVCCSLPSTACSGCDRLAPWLKHAFACPWPCCRRTSLATARLARQWRSPASRRLGGLHPRAAAAAGAAAAGAGAAAVALVVAAALRLPRPQAAAPAPAVRPAAAAAAAAAAASWVGATWSAAAGACRRAARCSRCAS
jgi:hypothetical protein